MKRFMVLLRLLLFLSRLPAQVTDDFTGVLDSRWVGDDSLFTVNAAGQLQSNASGSRDFCLSTGSAFHAGFEWEAWFRNAFSPSTQNFFRFYLLSDQYDLKGPLNGFYVQIGGVTENTDSITLYQQTGLVRTRLIAGRPATVSKSNNVVRVRVIFDSTAQWILYSDTGGGFHFQEEGRAPAPLPAATGYTGFWCKSTAGNVRNFYADDLYAGPVRRDTLAPRVLEITVSDAHHLRVVFSEEMELQSLLDAQNYTLNGGYGMASRAVAARPTEVLLTFDSAFRWRTTSELHMENLSDLNGNALGQATVPVVLFIPGPGDLLISELMADPSPPVDLPEREFVEVYNNSGYPVNIKGWSLSDGSATAVFGAVVLPPDTFVVLCHQNDSMAFAAFGPVAPAPVFPLLNNSGDELMLKDAAGKIIHRLHYTLNDYHDVSRSNGGWSLEMHNPKRVCQLGYNYGASVNMHGGTPGRRNSQWIAEPDTLPPQVSRIEVPDSTRIRIVFSEAMDSLTLMQQEVWLNGEVLTGIRAVTGETHDSLIIHATGLWKNRLNTLQFAALTDCSGNRHRLEYVFEYLVPEPASPLEVLIHEVMADPEGVKGLAPVEYIELYNRSEHVLSTENWLLCDQTDTTKLPAILLKPGAFAVLLSATHAGNWMGPTPAIGVPGFPALGNTEDEVTLLDASGKWIHSIHYSTDWIKNGAKRSGGYSYEMIDPGNPCGMSSNWDACQAPAGGTPGMPNSIGGTSQDEVEPACTGVFPIDSLHVLFSFTEPLHPNTGFFIRSEPELSLRQGGFNNFRHQSLLAELHAPILPETRYRIWVDSFSDCVQHNAHAVTGFPLELPVQAQAGEVVINELLFNPKPECVDYVEVYNRSNHVFDCAAWKLAGRDPDGQLTNSMPIQEHRLIFPGEWLAITPDATRVNACYQVMDAQALLQQDIPPMNDDTGWSVLLNSTDQVIDEVAYAKGMHYPLLADEEGVSLERIDPWRPADDVSNWLSASSASGYGTPGYRNSQFMHTPGSESTFQLSAPVFSPDNDGYQDELEFAYRLNEAGCTGTIRVFNDQGILVAQPVQQAVLGTSGKFSWNGITMRGTRVPVGIYIVCFEWFSLNGEVGRVKKAVAVAAKL